MGSSHLSLVREPYKYPLGLGLGLRLRFPWVFNSCLPLPEEEREIQSFLPSKVHF